MNTTVRERRRVARYRVNVPIEIEEVGTGSTVDISATGVAFFIEAMLEAGADIRFELRVDDVVLQCTGRVVRTEVRDGRSVTAASIDDLLVVSGRDH